MKRIYLSFLLFLAAYAANAQTVTVISPTGDGGFETGTTLAANGWTYAGDPTVNAWYVGTVAFTAGSRGCYVGQSMFDNNGGNSVGTTNHIYRNVTIPAGATNVQLSFKLRYTTSEYLWDRFCVSIYPTTTTPTTGYYTTAYPYTGTTGAVPPGVIAKLYENSNVYSTFQVVNSSTPAGTYSTSGALLNLSAYAGTSFRLCFTFTNADQWGTAGNPALDEISLTYDVPCTPPAAISGSLSVCQGNSNTLSSATGGGTWVSSNTSVATVSGSGSTASVTGISGGTATISYIVASCPRTAVVTVAPVPAATVTATQNVFCTGSSTQLTGAASLPPIVMEENFNGSLGGWTINNLAGTSTTYFQLRPSPGYAGVSGDGTQMMQAAPDALNGLTNTNVVSPVFSLVGYTSATLTLNQYYYAYYNDQVVAIEYSTNGGSTWTTLQSIIGTTLGSSTWSASSPTSTYTLPPAMIGQANCRLRWNYQSIYGFYWAIDNIKVNGVSGPQPVTWSPTTNLYTNAALTVPYTGASTGSPVYAAPTAATVPTYNTYAAGFTIGACTNYAGNTTLTVNPVPAAITGTASVCQTRTTTLSTTSTGGVWSSGATGVATVVGSGSSATVTGVAAGTALISYTYPTGCYTTRVVTVLAAPAAINGTSFQVCETSSITLTHPDGGTGTWLSVSPSVATIGLSSGIVSGISSGYATISYTNTNGCVVTRDVTVNPLPIVTVSPAATSTVCLGAGSTFTATSPAPQINLLAQDFNSGLGSWAITNTGGNAASYFQIVSPAGIADFAGDGSQYLQAAAMAYTSGSTVSTITSPSFSTTGGFGTVTLSFNQYLFSFSPDVAASIEYSINGGATWTTIINQAPGVITDNGADGNWSASSPEYSVALPAGAMGQSNVKLRWVYNAQSLYWLIDNITVKGTMPASTFNWSGAAGLSCTSCATAVITPTMTGTNGYNVTTTTSAGCITNTPVTMTVNPLPAPITGSLTICEGITGSLSSTPGGTWLSTNLAKATVTSGSGAITGVAAGTTNITYTLSTTGCQASAVATVLAAPAAITPASVAICYGDNATLSNATGSGIWSSSNAAVAPVSSTGVVNGAATGTANITYTIPTGCVAVRTVTVNALPAAIGGATTVCDEAVTTLSNSTLFGSWSSANAGIASVNSVTGDVTGESAGNTFISYILPTGCYAIKPMQVNPLPLPTTGASSVCQGLTTVVFNSSGGGSWSSSAPGIASIDASGIITGGSIAGTANILYTYGGTGCSYVHPFTVNPLPVAITGTQKVCKEATVTFGNTDAFGTWSSSDAAIASVGASTGVVTGNAVGSALITYTLPTGCLRTRAVSVNPLPNTISGANSVCFGSTASMLNTTPAGTWSSSDAGVASVSSTGLVTPVSVSGITTISYIVTATGCYATHDVQVNPLPDAITGTTTLCNESSTTLTSTSGGGSWTSSNTGVLLIGASSGLANAVGQGTANVTYTLPTGCRTNTSVAVNPLPGNIYGSTEVCQGKQTTLGSLTGGGNWSSSDGAVASVNASGVVTGGDAGAAMITYMLSTGCYRTTAVSVNALPGAITGTFAVCSGSSTLLSSADGGGSWTSSNPAVANVNVLGNVTGGLISGGATITYTLPTGCLRTQAIAVNPLPGSITGTTTVCEGLTTDLNNSSAGGTWSSEATAIATVDPSTGLVTGEADGTTNIIYTLPTGCSRMRSVVVNPTPSDISGTLSSCPGQVSTLTSSPSDGTWTSGSSSVASINALGMVTANAAGAAGITYTLPAGCRKISTFVVNPLPAAIGGTRVVCKDNSTNLTNASAGGTWSVISGAVASIDGASGTLTGAGAGVTQVVYTLPTGCSRTTNVTVNALPADISGTLSMCQGASTSLGSSPAGGTWTTGDAAVATISNSGMVSGIAAGNAGVTYTLPTGCRTTSSVAVNALPDDITGATSVCLGQQATVINTTGGGNWSIDNGGVASIDAFGTVTGLGTGSATVKYTLGTGCAKSRTFVVNPLPAAITGTTGICQGSAATLANATNGGSWSSSNPSVAQINSSGLATGMNVGFSIINYTLPTGCSANTTVVINALPEPITGTPVMCIGGSATLESNTVGGSWSSSSTAASVNASGEVTGVAAGTAVITYMTGNGCRRIRVATINALPGVITGTASVCPGLTTTLGNAVSGGSWSSNATTVATISNTGVVMPQVTTGGTAEIVYTLPTGCSRSRIITVHPAVEAITGAGTVCRGLSTTLENLSTGGEWSSSNNAVATVDAGTGIVTGTGAGTAVMAYTLPTGCKSTMTMVVNPLPGNISGANTVCEGSTVNLSNTVPGGSWSTSDATVTLSSTGAVSGVTAGTANITYTLATGCMNSRSIAVAALPELKNVTGGGSYCAGGTGVAIMVDGSEAGTMYKLMNGSVTPVLTTMGAGSSITYPNQTGAGTYNVVAVSPAGCMRTMTGSPVVSITNLVTPSVSISSDKGNTVCDGTTVVFSATGVNGGTTPGHTWNVNGTDVGTASSYSYVPVNGDVVTIRYASSEACPSVASVSSAMSMAVRPNLAPSVTIVAGPGNKLCAGNTATFSATGVNGGTSPVYTWLVDGNPVAGVSSSVYTYQPENNDLVVARLNSNYACPSTNNVSSNGITMEIGTVYVPVVAINANPGNVVPEGTEVTFTATVSNAGPSPEYQWLVNQAEVTGATQPVFKTNKLKDGDAVTCRVQGTGECSKSSINEVVMEITPATTGVTVRTIGNSEIRLVPNPNTGTFTVSGTLAVKTDKAVSFEVTDMLGQVVYRGQTTARNGVVDAQITLGNTLANGMYMLNMGVGAERKAFHFVVKQ